MYNFEQFNGINCIINMFFDVEDQLVNILRFQSERHFYIIVSFLSNTMKVKFNTTTHKIGNAKEKLVFT